jgi:hypothetical protein
LHWKFSGADRFAATGAMDPAKLTAAQAAGKSLPGPHTSLFELVPEPTLRTGETAMTTVAVALLRQ